MMNTKEEQMRAEFEAWAAPLNVTLPLKRDESGLYVYASDRTNAALMAWQAALNSLEGKSVPEGWKLVPIEPTKAMEFEGAKEGFISDKRTNGIYKAMLAAAPQQPQEDRVRELETELARAQYRLEHMLPVFEEARDALTAIPLASAKLHSVSLTLADRMDEIGTMSQQAVDSAIAAMKEPNKGKDDGQDRR